MIDNPVTLSFCNETVRPIADRLAGLMQFPELALNAAIGKGIVDTLGTKVSDLLRETPWSADDYAAIPVQTIKDSDTGGRTLLTNHDVIGLLRVMVVLGGMSKANVQFAPLVARIAVNPQAR